MGLCFLALIMVLSSYLSSRLRGQRTALEALSTEERAAPASVGEGKGALPGDEMTGLRDEARGAASGDDGISADRGLAGVSSPGDLPGPESSGTGERTAAESATAEPAVGGGKADAVPASRQTEVRWPETSPQEETSPNDRSRDGSPSGDLTGALFKAVLGLAAVAAILAVIRRLGSRKGRKAGFPMGEGRLEVLGFTPLGPSSGIYEVRVGGRVLLVGEAERGLSLLGELDAEELVTAEEAEMLEDEFLSMLREELRGTASSSPGGRGSLLDELRWKTSRSRSRRRP